MDVDIILEGVFQGIYIGDMCEQVQFDLGIVGGDQDIVWFGDEDFVDFVVFFGVDWDVLQVWIG